MEKMGFGAKWIRWIKCSLAHFSVLINGTLTSFFQSSRCPRQGDPLFSFLFIMAMELRRCFLYFEEGNGKGLSRWLLG